MEAPVFLGIGMGFIPGVDDASGRGGGGGGLLVDVLGALGQKKVGLAGHLEDFSGTRKDLPGYEERDKLLGHLPEVQIPSHEIIFMAAIGIAHGVRVVFEDINVSFQTFLPQPLFSNGQAGL